MLIGLEELLTIGEAKTSLNFAKQFIEQAQPNFEGMELGTLKATAAYRADLMLGLIKYVRENLDKAEADLKAMSNWRD